MDILDILRTFFLVDDDYPHQIAPEFFNSYIVAVIIVMIVWLITLAIKQASLRQIGNYANRNDVILINSLGTDINILQQFTKEHLIKYLESRSDTYVHSLPLSQVSFYISPESFILHKEDCLTNEALNYKLEFDLESSKSYFVNIYFNIPVEIYRILVFYSSLLVKQSSNLSNTNEVAYNTLLLTIMKYSSMISMPLISQYDVDTTLFDSNFKSTSDQTNNIQTCDQSTISSLFFDENNKLPCLLCEKHHITISIPDTIILKYKPKYSPEQIHQLLKTSSNRKGTITSNDINTNISTNSTNSTTSSKRSSLSFKHISLSSPSSPNSTDLNQNHSISTNKMNISKSVENKKNKEHNNIHILHNQQNINKDSMTNPSQINTDLQLNNNIKTYTSKPADLYDIEWSITYPLLTSESTLNVMNLTPKSEIKQQEEKETEKEKEKKSYNKNINQTMYVNTNTTRTLLSSDIQSKSNSHTIHSHHTPIKSSVLLPCVMITYNKLINPTIIQIHILQINIFSKNIVKRSLLIDMYGTHLIKPIYENEDDDCIICFSQHADIILLPCRHKCICKNCVSMIDKCPICRLSFTLYIHEK